MRKIILTLVVILVGAAVVAPRWRTLLGRPAGEAQAQESAKPSAALSNASAPLRVTAVTAISAPLAETIAATGTLRPEEGVDLVAESSGKIVALNIQEGARVQKGDLLVKLNDADLRATLQRAAWRRELAELKERRLSQLLLGQAVKQEDYDTAVNDLNVQRAEVAITEALIAKTEIRAPFDGVIGLRFVSEGAFVNATSRIATLQNVDHLKIDFSVPEKYASRITLGSPIAFTVPGGDRKFTGRLYAIEPHIDPATRTALLRAICPNPDGRLLSGGFASVEFTLAEIPAAIVIPNIAVIPGVTEKNVFVVIDGKAQRRTVQTGTRKETTVHILDGVKPGDVVITSGLQQLRDGQPVNVVTTEADARPAGHGKTRERTPPAADDPLPAERKRSN
jgi:membrane fusion protein, multidrug efflux system